MLSLGLAVGGHLDSLSLTSSVSAVPHEGLAEPGLAEAGLNLVQCGQHISDVASRVVPAVVHIQATRLENERKVEETGSGVLMRTSAARGLYVVTNQHVIRGADTAAIDVVMHSGESVHPQRVYRDTESDLAILQIPDGGQASAEWGDSETVDIGHFVLAVGSPFGLSQSVTMGIVSRKGTPGSVADGRPFGDQSGLSADRCCDQSGQQWRTADRRPWTCGRDQHCNCDQWRRQRGDWFQHSQ
ncbi:MAG UNVERIFIED_CONTAM: S1C family serine protease [Planctomycetaceae bacterium]|jgi:serine protease Do